MAVADLSIPHVRTLLIFSYNQSALQSISKPGTTSGKIIIRDILDVIQKLRARRIETKFYWVPAHTGIAGNEKADKVAKESTGWRTQTKRHGRQIEINTDKTAYQIQVPSRQPLEQHIVSRFTSAGKRPGITRVKGKISGF